MIIGKIAINNLSSNVLDNGHAFNLTLSKCKDNMDF